MGFVEWNATYAATDILKGDQTLAKTYEGSGTVHLQMFQRPLRARAQAVKKRKQSDDGFCESLYDRCH